MKVFLILIALIIAITLYKQKYLGKLAPIIIILSLLFITFRGHIEKLWENNIESFSGKDRLTSSLVSFWNFAEGDKDGVYFSNNAGGNNNAKIVKNEGLVLSSARDWAETDFINKPLSGSKSLVAWATVKDADKSKGGAPISIFKDENQNFDGIIWAERENNKWMIGSDRFNRTNKGTTTTPESPIDKKQCIVMTQDYSEDNIVIKLYIDGEKVDEYTSPNKTTYEAGKWRLYFGPRHTNRGRTRRDGHFIGTIHAAGVFDKALNEDEVKEVNSLLDLQLSKIEDNIVYSNFENFTFNDTNKELSDSNDLKLTDKFTVMAWVKQKEKTNGWVRIIGKGSKTNRNYGLWVKKDGQLLSQVYTDNNNRYSNVRVTNSHLENDKWTHLAMTYNKDGRQRLYKNGKMIEANDSKGIPLTDDQPLTIGGANFHDKFKGEIKGAVVLNTVLSKQEVKHFAESPDKNLDEILGKNLTNNNKTVKYGETIDLQLIDGQTKEPIPLLKILYAGTKTPAPTELNGNHIVKITDANNENKILVMGKDRLLTMIDETSEPKPEYDTDLFLLKPEIGELGEREYKEKLVTYPIKHGDKIAISIWSKKQGRVFYNGCGYFGCRVLYPEKGTFSHGGKNKDTVPYTTIKNVPMADEKEVLDTTPSGTGTLPDSEMDSSPKSTGTGTLPVSEMISQAEKGDGYTGYDPNVALSENINQYTQPPTLTKGLTTENVTPSPIYFEPGTVKYGGLGYKPSYEDINYMNNKFITKPEVVSDFNKRGFCDLENNIMENIDEKCGKLPKEVCASTSCCVLLGDQRCVQGNKQGPTNKGVYSDTTIKNRDAYYYRGKCFGNCSDVPNTNSLPQEMPEMDAVNPSPESEM